MDVVADDEFGRERCIIALVGPLGSGKRTLAMRVADLYAATHGEQLSIFPMTTTRKLTDRPIDRRFFQHMDLWRFTALSMGGRMIDAMEHDGARYGYDRGELEDALERRDVILPMRATAVVAMRQLGHTVHVVRVLAEDRSGRSRFPADRDPVTRACSLRADMTLLNVFDRQGLEMAVNQLAYLVTVWTGHEHPRSSDDFYL
jgi:guanylate kinase